MRRLRWDPFQTCSLLYCFLQGCGRPRLRTLQRDNTSFSCYLAGRSNMKTRISLLTLIGSCLCFLGCATATYTTTNRIDVDDESNDGGGIASADVRLVATSMCPEILALPEIIDSDETIRIKVADVKNSSRFFIDRNLFTKRLCVELNRHGDGAIRFINSTSTRQTAHRPRPTLIPSFAIVRL